MTEDEKKIGQEKLDLLLAGVRQNLREAEKVADQYGLTFHFIPQNLGDYIGVGAENEWTDEIQEGEGTWYPSEWSSSSVYC